MSTNPPPLRPPPMPPPQRPAKSGIPLPLIIVGIVVLIIIGMAIIAGLAAPVLLRMKKKGDLVVAVSNGRSLSLVMNSFHLEYGSYPDRDTARLVTERNGSSLDLSGETANDYFRQIIAAGVVRSEEPFWAKTPYSPRPPDNIITRGEALKAGEVGWGYVMNGNRAVGRENPDQVIALTPVFGNSSKAGSGSRAFDGEELSVRVDGSVRIERNRPNRGSAPGKGPEAGEGVLVIKVPQTRE